MLSSFYQTWMKWNPSKARALKPLHHMSKYWKVFNQWKIFNVWLRSTFDFRKLSALIIHSILIELTFLSRMGAFCRKLHNHWEWRKQKKNFQISLVIIFSNFTMFYHRSNSPQIKPDLISSITNWYTSCLTTYELGRKC